MNQYSITRNTMQWARIRGDLLQLENPSREIQALNTMIALLLDYDFARDQPLSGEYPLPRDVRFEKDTHLP